MATVQLTITPEAMNARPALIMLATVLFLTSTFPLAAGYVSMVTLLLRRPRVAHHLSVFAPVGRMALTNYLTQTVVMLVVFYPFGGGLIGRAGPAVGLLIALAVFGAQAIASRIWLTHFQFGPVEWVWRSLTYGTPQPIRAGTAQDRVAVAANIV